MATKVNLTELLEGEDKATLLAIFNEIVEW